MKGTYIMPYKKSTTKAVAKPRKVTKKTTTKKVTTKKTTTKKPTTKKSTVKKTTTKKSTAKKTTTRKTSTKRTTTKRVTTRRAKSTTKSTKSILSNIDFDVTAYLDIDEHKEEILKQIKENNLENYKYIIPNEKMKKGEVNYPGINKSVVVINNKEYKVNNSEQYVNEFGVAMNPDDCAEIKYSIMEII